MKWKEEEVVSHRVRRNGALFNGWIGQGRSKAERSWRTERTYTHAECTAKVIQNNPRAGVACVVHCERRKGVLKEEEVGQVVDRFDGAPSRKESSNRKTNQPNVVEKALVRLGQKWRRQDQACGKRREGVGGCRDVVSYYQSRCGYKSTACW